jgi:hypothetical protein
LQLRCKCITLFCAVLSFMADQLAAALDATAPRTYRQRGVSSLQRLFRAHYPELFSRYDAEFATQLGKFRLPRISSAVARFLGARRDGWVNTLRLTPG